MECAMSEQNYQSTVGSEVYSRDGANVGSVTQIVDQDGKPAFLQVKDSGLFGIGADSFLVPFSAILSTEEGKITVNRSRQDLVGLPAHDEKEQKSPSYFQSLFAWWGTPNDH